MPVIRTLFRTYVVKSSIYLHPVKAILIIGLLAHLSLLR